MEYFNNQLRYMIERASDHPNTQPKQYTFGTFSYLLTFYFNIHGEISSEKLAGRASNLRKLIDKEPNDVVSPLEFHLVAVVVAEALLNPCMYHSSIWPQPSHVEFVISYSSIGPGTI